MANEDEGSKSGRKKPEDERKFSQQQYDMLKSCSEKMDISEWNNWRKEHPDEEIRLQGANFERAHLENANLREAHLENAFLVRAHLENANLSHAHLRNAKLIKAYLENTELIKVHLEDATVFRTNLKGAELFRCHLQGTRFQGSILDDSTLLYKCVVDRYTDFRDAGLNSARVDAGTKQLLEYNIRRMNWDVWYKEHWLLQWPVKLFWSFSDYGMSTQRVLVTFLGLALVFANIYYYWGRVVPPGIVDTLFVDRNGIEVESWLVPLRALYFSVVTMTTLGFGDMYANAHSVFGHILLSLQVILGYVLLGALVTRFAVLFSAGGPAGKFTPIKTKEKAGGKKNKS